MFFDRSDTPKVPLFVKASTPHVIRTSFLDPLDSAYQAASQSSAVFAQLTEERPYTLQCAIKRD